MARFKHNALTTLALVSSFGLIACSKGGEAAETGDGTTDTHEDGGHAHKAQFGGKLVELGDHYANVEFVYLADQGELSVYALGAHAEKSVKSPTLKLVGAVTAGEEAFNVTLLPQESASTGEKAGDSSHFMVTDARLKNLDHFDIEIETINVRGKDFTEVSAHLGAAHGSHDDDDHDHDHEGGDEDHDHDHDGDDHDHEHGSEGGNG